MGPQSGAAPGFADEQVPSSPVYQHSECLTTSTWTFPQLEVEPPTRLIKTQAIHTFQRELGLNKPPLFRVCIHMPARGIIMRGALQELGVFAGKIKNFNQDHCSTLHRYDNAKMFSDAFAGQRFWLHCVRCTGLTGISGRCV